MFNVGHALHAARDHHIGGAGLNHHGRIDDRLQSGPAAPVDLIAGHFERETGGEPAPMSDRGCLGAAIALAEHHVIDPLGIDPAAFHQRFQDDRAQRTGFQRGERSEELAHRRAERRNDGGAA